MQFSLRVFAFVSAAGVFFPTMQRAPAEPPARTGGGVPVVVEKVYAPTDIAALRTQLHRRVVLEGTVAAIGKSGSGATTYLNFTKNYRASVSLVFLGGRKDEFPREKIAEFVGKKIHVGGLLNERSGALQVRVFDLEQIRVLS